MAKRFRANRHEQRGKRNNRHTLNRELKQAKKKEKQKAEDELQVELPYLPLNPEYELTIADNSLKHFMGLRFQPRKEMFFLFPRPKRYKVSNWFVFYPIDLVFMQRERGRLYVVEEKEGLRPFKTYKPRHKFEYLLEVPSV